MVRLKKVYRRILELARPYLRARDGEAHVRDVLRFAFELLDGGGGEEEVVIPAVILHDTGRTSSPKGFWIDPGAPWADLEVVRIHELEGVKVAEKVLREVNYESAKIAEILEIIDGHDTRPYALSVNDMIVKDADRLARYRRRFVLYTSRHFKVSPLKVCERLEAFIGRWFYLERSKGIAREEIAKRRREVLSGDGLCALWDSDNR